MADRPVGHGGQSSGTGHSIGKHGDGLGGGPVGNGARPQNQTGGAEKGVAGGSGSGLLVAGLLWLLLGKKGGSGNGQNGNGSDNMIGKIIRIAILAILVIALLKACGGAGAGSSYEDVYSQQAYVQPTQTPVHPTVAPVQPTASVSAPSVNTGASSANAYSYGDLSSLFQYSGLNTSAYSSGWTYGDNRNKLNTSVAPGTRARFYTPKSGDDVTVMVYMCGTDLEASGGYATKDMMEMARASLNDNNVNLLIYGGGCKNWSSQARQFMSNSKNVLVRLKNGGNIETIAQANDTSMTNPNTLSDFIKYSASKYPAERYILIFWDHGGGSLTGYGYDQRHTSSGSMTIDNISKALDAGGIKFDFVGFDACLMATYETAMAVSKNADYMIASEESEPGIGWSYTNWLNKLSADTSVSTLELGKTICDSFVSDCATSCRGQDATLSLIDLAELSATAPSAMSQFSSSTISLVSNNQYSTVSKARGSAKEFAAGNKLDQVDLIDFAANLGNNEGNGLANALLSAVKYNVTSNTVNNAYGISAYFPYRSISSVNTAVSTFNGIGLGNDYAKAIQAFASYAAAGQNTFGGGLPTGSFGSGQSTSNAYSSYSSEDIYDILSALMGASSPYGRCLTDAAANGDFDAEQAAQYLFENQFDAANLSWQDGKIILTENQWNLVQDLVLSLYIDDGEGYFDMGLDLNNGSYDEEGNVLQNFNNNWLAINGWNCAYYHEKTVVDGDNITITGYVPVLLNEQRAYLLITIENDVPAVTGIRYNYVNDETETIAKSFALDEISADDEITLIADYYDYDYNFVDVYAISDPMTYGDGLEVSWMTLDNPDAVSAMYRFTDIYNNNYWSPEI